MGNSMDINKIQKNYNELLLAKTKYKFLNINNISRFIIS